VVKETLMTLTSKFKYSIQKHSCGAGGVAQVVEHLPRKHNTLISNPSAAKKKKKKKKPQ
jgi:hypothetical protein